jgi:hypothetical protein
MDCSCCLGRGLPAPAEAAAWPAGGATAVRAAARSQPRGDRPARLADRHDDAIRAPGGTTPRTTARRRRRAPSSTNAGSSVTVPTPGRADRKRGSTGSPAHCGRPDAPGGRSAVIRPAQACSVRRPGTPAFTSSTLARWRAGHSRSAPCASPWPGAGKVRKLSANGGAAPGTPVAASTRAKAAGCGLPRPAPSSSVNTIGSAQATRPSAAALARWLASGPSHHRDGDVGRPGGQPGEHVGERLDRRGVRSVDVHELRHDGPPAGRRKSKPRRRSGPDAPLEGGPRPLAKSAVPARCGPGSGGGNPLRT